MSWSIFLLGPAERDLKRLDSRSRERIVHALRRLAEREFGDIKKLQGAEDEYRLRVGDFRILFRFDSVERAIKVLRILPRGRAYRVREHPEKDYQAADLTAIAAAAQ